MPSHRTTIRNGHYALAAAVIIVALSGLSASPHDRVLTRLKDELRTSALPPEVQQHAARHLFALCTDQVVLAMVRNQNARKMPAAHVRRIDNAWRQARFDLPIMIAMRSNACARRLSMAARRLPWLMSVFITDRQGALAGATHRTPSYWQGGRPEWQHACAGGRGALYVGKKAYDESAHCAIVHVSMPLLESGSGAVVGVIVFGIKLEAAAAPTQ